MSDDIAEDAEDERAIELDSLAAIYPELITDPTDPFSAVINIPVEPAEPVAIYFQSVGRLETPQGLPTNPNLDKSSYNVVANATSSHPALDTFPTTLSTDGPIEESTEDVHLLSHLPPITLYLKLPDGYPSYEPPFFAVLAPVNWIPDWRLRQLKDTGLALWEELGKDQVLFSYIDSLRDAAEQCFDLRSQATGRLQISQNLKLALLDFDLKAKQAKFESETFSCSICLEPKKGVKCHRLDLCGHVNCVACLQDYFNTCITEGDVTSVKCITPSCSDELHTGKAQKQDRTLDPSELLQIPLSQEQVQRYIALKRKKRYDADPTTVYCPRTWCQGPARTKSSEEEKPALETAEEGPNPPKSISKGYISPADRLAICQDCSFAFCQVCKASWHGEFVYCRTRNVGELSEEEKASEQYLKLHSTLCPTCTAPCQKSMGCNHMICPTCTTHFCYLCSSWLSVGNPYQHFNDNKNPCYMRLWELENGDGGEGLGIGFGGGVGDEFVDSDNESDLSDSETDSSDDESDDDDPPPVNAARARNPGRGRGAPPGGRGAARGGRGNARAGARGAARGGGRGRGPRGGGGRGDRGGRGGAPNIHVNARAQAGLQRPAVPVAGPGNDPVLPMQEFMAAAAL